MPRSKEKNEAMRAATREKILDSAIVLFSQKGAAGTGVQEIADKAGMSVGLLYRHFKTKDDIFRAVVQLAIDGLKEMEKYLDNDPLETIKWWADDVLNDVLTNENFTHMLNVLSPEHIADENFPCKEEITEAHLFFRKSFANLIARGQKDGVFRKGNPIAMATLFLSMIDGLCGMKLALPNEFVPPSPQMLTAFIIKEEVE